MLLLNDDVKLKAAKTFDLRNKGSFCHIENKEKGFVNIPVRVDLSERERKTEREKGRERKKERKKERKQERTDKQTESGTDR